MELNRTVAIGVASSVASLAVGSVAGYLVAKRKLERKYEDYANEKIAEARRKFKIFYKRDDEGKPTSLASTDDEEDENLPIMDEAVTAILNPVLAQYDPPRQFSIPQKTNGHNPSSNEFVDPYDPRPHDTDKDGTPLEEANEQHWNVFERQLDNMDDDTEEQYPVLGDRVEGKPYVISTAEFNADDRGYIQVTLSYYADGTLVEEGNPAEEMLKVQDVLGPNAIKYFGYDPDEPDTIHVRNDRLRIDYEVVKDERRWGQDILGLEPGNPLLETIEEMQRQHREAVGPPERETARSRFSHYNPGGVVRAAGGE